MDPYTNDKYVDFGAAAFKWSLIVIFALLCAISLQGCNTFAGGAKFVKGVGDDIEALARGTQAWLAKDAANSGE